MHEQKNIKLNKCIYCAQFSYFILLSLSYRSKLFPQLFDLEVFNTLKNKDNVNYLQRFIFHNKMFIVMKANWITLCK